MRTLFFIVMALALAACSAIAGAAGNQSEIEQNKEKWLDANISQSLPRTLLLQHQRYMPIIEVQDGGGIHELQRGEIDPTF
jgi:hypothetical protein